MKKYLGTGLVCILIIVIAAVVSFGRISSAEAQVEANQARIGVLKNKLDVAQSSVKKTENTLVLTETGFDADRVALDEAAAREFMRKVFRWSSNAEYVTARANVADEYNLSDKDPFMTTFMPEPYVSVARDGTEYPQIDILGIEADFDELSLQVKNISGDTYSYFAHVRWHIKIKDGTVESTESVFMFDTNSDNELSNLEAYNVR